jgi:fatty-acyl-CoA synthase
VGRRIDLARRTLRALPRLRELRPTARVSVADRIEERVRAQPDHPFLLFGESGEPRAWSYAEFNAAANRVAWWALDRGLRRGDVVALLMENRPEYLSTWAGLAKAGVTTALINSNLAGRALRHALAAAGTDRLVVGTECLDRFATTAEDLARPLEAWLVHEPTGAAVPTAVPRGVRDLDADLASRSPEDPDPCVREELRAGDDIFYIYTSGTTCLPKAARFSHARFLGIGLGEAVSIELEPQDVHYCALPLYHTAGGVMMVSAVLAAGATLALRRRFSARAFWDDCRRFGATRFQYIGEFCRYLLNQPPGPGDRDHRVRIVIGNGLRPDIWEPFQQRFGLERIVEFYGATEGNVALVNLDGRAGAVGRIPFGRIGERFSNARLVRYDIARDAHVRDARGFCTECGADEPGELIGRIADAVVGRFEGYTSHEATEKKILRDVFARGDAWFRTGDLLRRDRDGWFYFVDRIGDTFRWKGENVSTQEVAETLMRFPGVEMANVYGVEVLGHDGRAGMAALVLSDPDAFDAGAFHAFVGAELPRYAAPLFVRLVREPDVTGTFKLRKVDLQREGFDVSHIQDPVYLRDDEVGAYLPLTKKLRKQVLSGELRL